MNFTFMNLLILNVIILTVWSIGYILLRNSESKSMFLSSIMSDLWLYHAMPVTGFIFNLIGFISSLDKTYIVIGLIYLLFTITRVSYQCIVAKLDRSYYEKNMPIIREKLDRYINSSNLNAIKDYKVILSKTSYTNDIILKIEDNGTFNWDNYLNYKSEIEFMFFEYNMRVSYEKI